MEGFKMARTIGGKAIRGISSLIAVIGLVILGMIFIIAPGLLIGLGCTLIKTFE